MKCPYCKSETNTNKCPNCKAFIPMPTKVETVNAEKKDTTKFNKRRK